MRSVLLVMAIALAPATASAQQADPYRVASQAVALFQQACLPFTGSPGDLRAWASARHLPETSPQQALPFLGGHPGKVYGASTQDGKMALASEDNGGCRVVVEFGDKASVDTALQGAFHQMGAIVLPVNDRGSADGKASQTLLKVLLGSRSVLVSTATHVHPEAPSALPTLVMHATGQ